MTAYDDSIKKRTGWIWVISIFYVISAGWTLLSYYLIYSGAIPIRPGQEAYFKSMSSIDIGVTLVLGLGNIAGAVALFLLNRVAFYLFSTTLTVSIIITIWHILAKGWLQALSTAGLVGVIIGFGISAAVCAYAWKLIQKGILT